MKGLFRKPQKTNNRQGVGSSVGIVKIAAKEYITMAVAEKERFHKQEKLTILPWDPIRFLERINLTYDKHNYWMAYCKTADSYDEEVANLFMVIQVLLIENDESISAYLEHNPDEFFTKNAISLDTQRLLLKKAVESLSGSYFQEKLENKAGFRVAKEVTL